MRFTFEICTLNTILSLVNEDWEVGNPGRIGTLFKGRYDLMGCDAVLFGTISNNNLKEFLMTHGKICDLRLPYPKNDISFL